MLKPGQLININSPNGAYNFSLTIVKILTFLHAIITRPIFNIAVKAAEIYYEAEMKF